MAFLAVMAVIVLAGVLYQWAGSRRDRKRFERPGVLIDVGGHRLHVVCRGSGSPAVILESGIAASSLSWTVIQPEIARFATVCAYDRAGLAWSDAPSCPRTFSQIVNELAAVVAGVAPTGRCVLVGHSFGTFVVRGYAMSHPERILGLVLVDPPTEWLSLTRQRARMLSGARYLSRCGAWLARIGVVRGALTLLAGGRPAAPRRFAKMFGSTASQTLERLVGEVRKLPPAVHPLIQAHWSDPKCFYAMADYLEALQRERGLLSALETPREIPLVVISSGRQSAEQLAAHRALANHASDGRHVLASNSGHWIQFDEPDVIVRAVRELMERDRA